MVARSTSAFPVSGSIATSTSSAANDGPTCFGSAEAEAVTGPPVAISLPAISLKVSRSSGFFDETKTPSMYSISPGCVSQSSAARRIIWSLMSWAALTTAMPVAKAVRLPPVTPV